MKASTRCAIIALAASCQILDAFVPSPCSNRHRAVPGQAAAAATTSLSATGSRRDILVGTGLLGIVAVLTGAPVVADAENRPMYLTEPTDDFKANEAKAMEFKRQQLAIKKEFSAILEKFLAEPNDGDALEKDLRTLKALVAKTGGLPLGIKKDELFKVIRSKKAKGFWPTPVEIAYQSLIQEISYQQSPNLDKEMGNPYQ
ncbi:hypothetical protein IV203_037665 [Nitzschia inconspicua]|uniref:Uncharacterized protein n=1 Tax=Nitzschia inconspicua TaxID=303405 RepID=A0A9K3LLD7_9STRA|nr:hypothetical protein IV203_037665 [Nitzschia inconspicua]